MTIGKKILSATNEPMLSVRKTAKRLGCATDYVGRLCREGKLDGVRVKNTWFIDAQSVVRFEASRKEARTERAKKLSHIRRQESLEYKKQNGTRLERWWLASISNHLPHRAALVASIILLCTGVVFAATVVTPIRRGTPTTLVASIGQVESPFFGVHPVHLSLPESFSPAGILANLVGSLFPHTTMQYATDNTSAPTSTLVSLPPIPSPIVVLPPAASSTVVAQRQPAPIPAPVAVVPVQPRPQIIQQNTYPIIERTVIHTVDAGGVSVAMLSTKLSELSNALRSQIALVSSPGYGSPLGNLSLPERINNLSNVTVSGVSGLTAADIPHDIVASKYLPLSGGTLTGAVIDTSAATSTFSGGIDLLSGCLSINGVCLSSIGGGGSAPVWGNITGSITDQTDLTNALTSKFALTDWYATTTDALAEGLTHQYYSNTRVGAYIAASTTIPKLYTDNTFTGGVIFGNSTTTNATTTSLFAQVASSTNLFASFATVGNLFAHTLSLSTLNGPLQAINGVLSATSSIGVTYGGTGLSAVPNYGQVLLGNGSGGYTLTATSSLGITSAAWGNITGSITDQTDLTNALTSKFALTDWYATTTDALAEGLTHQYYSNTRVGAYIAASTTIPKLYTDNTFTGGVIFGNSTTTNATTTSLFAEQAGAGKLEVTGVGRFDGPLTLAAFASCTASRALQTDASGNISCGSIAASGSSAAGGWQTDNAGLVSLSTTTDLAVVGATSTPYAKFTIVSGATATTTLALMPATAQTANILDVYTTSGTLGSVLTAAGNLGLGTTSPWRTLSVKGASDLGNNALAGYFTASSTIASVFPFASTTALTVSGAGGLSLAALNGPLQANNGTVSATTSVGVTYGGTGLTVAPSYGNILVGTGSGGYALSATSSLFGSGLGGQILTWSNGVPSWIASTTYAGSNGITTSFANGQLTIVGSNAAADGVTKGVAAFTAADFNDASGVISLDYGNGQKASATQIGFLKNSDWAAFTAKLGSTTIASLSDTVLAKWNAATNTFTNSLLVDTGAAVGVATSSPAATFSVQGTGLFSGLLSVAGITATGTIAANTLTLTNALAVGSGGTGIGTAPAFGQILVGNNSGGYTFAATSSLGFLATSSISSTAPITYDAVGGVIGFDFTRANIWTGLQQFTANASTTQLSATAAFFGGTATSTFTATGALGIGTTSPMSALSVSGGNITQVASGSPTLAANVSTANQTYGTYVSGNYAYVADNGGGLRIIDVTNPKNPSVVGAYTGISAALAVVVSGKYAYVSDTSTGLNIIDVSNPAVPILVGTYPGGRAPTLALSGHYIYMPDPFTGNVNSIDVANPTAPTLAGRYTTDPSIGLPYAVAVSGKYLYVGDQGTTNKIYVLNISNPAAPTLVSTYATNLSAPTSIYISGKYAYVTDQSKGLQILSIANPTSLAPVGSYSPTSNFYGVQVAGKYAYIAEHTNGTVLTVDVSNPASPALVGTYTAGSQPRGIVVAGKYAFVADYSGGLVAVDINGIESPAANIGAIQTNTINVADSMNVGGDIFAGGGLNVGLSGIYSRGGLAVFGSTTLTDLFAKNASTTQLSIAGSAGGTTPIFTIATSTSAYATTTALQIDKNGVLVLPNNYSKMLIGNALVANTGESQLTIQNGNGDTATTSITFAQSGAAGFEIGSTQPNATSFNIWNSNNGAPMMTLTRSGSVAGNAAFRGATSGMNNTGYVSFRDNVNATNGFAMGYDATNNWSWLNSGTVGNQNRSMAFWTNGQNANLPTFIIGPGGNNSSPRVGVATSSPYASLSVHANNGDTNQTLFAIGSSTQSATSTLFAVTNTGNVGINSSAPTKPLEVIGTNSSAITRAASVASFTFNTAGHQYDGAANSAGLYIGGDSTAVGGAWLQGLAYNSDSIYYPILLNPKGGNVGIGSTTPWAQLSINPNGISGPAFAIGSSTQTLFTVGQTGLIGAGNSVTGNLFMGSGAGVNYVATTTLPSNTAFGVNAMNTATSSFFVTAVGYGALAHLNDCQSRAGASNCLLTAVGTDALGANTTGFWNTAVGAGALASNTTGQNNNAFGANALFANTTGSNNQAIGFGTLTGNITGGSNVAVGSQALQNTNANGNVAMGVYAGFFNTAGSNNLYIGGAAGTANVSVLDDSNSVIDTNMLFIGSNSSRDRSGLASTSVMNNSIALGNNSRVGASNSMAIGGLGANAVNVGIGSSTPFATLSVQADQNKTLQSTTLFAIASSTAISTTTLFAVDNIGNTNIQGAYMMNGQRVLTASTTTSNLFGGLSGNTTASGTGNIAFSPQSSLGALTTGQKNIAMGVSALSSLRTGSSNIGIGDSAGNRLELSGIGGGSENIFIGDGAGFDLRTANNSVIIGGGAEGAGGTSFTNSSGDTYLGAAAGYNINNSYNNTLLGYHTGNNLSDGYGNLLVGANPDMVTNLTTGSGNVGIGYNVNFPSATANNQLSIGNFLFGTLPATSSNATLQLPTTGTFGVGSTSPFAMLSVQANNGSTNTTLFAVGSSTQNATTTLFSVANTGVVTINGSGGSCTLGSGSGNTLCSSDARLKTNITPIDDALDKLARIKGVTYNWADPAKDQRQLIGVIAQDVQQAFPQSVATTSNGYLAVDYSSLVAPLIQGVNLLHASTTADEATIASLQASVAALQSVVGSVGMTISHGAAHFMDLFAAHITTQDLTVGSSERPAGITLYDTATHAPYCFLVTNGAATTTPGVCAGASTNVTAATSSAATSSAPVSIQAPVLSLVGINPSMLSVGDVYSDLGVTVTDGANSNLGYYASVDGAATTTPDQIGVDTVVPGTHTIIYSATNQAGVTGYTSRTVLVQALAVPAATSTATTTN